MSKARGKFIVIEGIDGSGKSVQVEMLKTTLESDYGIPVYVTHEPTNSPIGSLIRQVLTGRIKMDNKALSMLYAADRYDHINNDIDGILHKIEEGITVITDRYYLSSYMYQSDIFPLDYLIQLNAPVRELLKPDVIFFIDTHPVEAMKRINKRGKTIEKFEDISILTKCRENFYRSVEKLQCDDNIVVIDGDRCEYDISSSILDYLQHNRLSASSDDNDNTDDSIIITHYDDGKEKYQSHEISFGFDSSDDGKIDSIDLNGSIIGYGESKEEALEEFKDNFFKKLNELNSFADKLRNNTLNTVEVDCLNKRI